VILCVDAGDADAGGESVARAAVGETVPDALRQRDTVRVCVASNDGDARAELDVLTLAVAETVGLKLSCDAVTNGDLDVAACADAVGEPLTERLRAGEGLTVLDRAGDALTEGELESVLDTAGDRLGVADTDVVVDGVRVPFTVAVPARRVPDVVADTDWDEYALAGAVTDARGLPVLFTCVVPVTETEAADDCVFERREDGVAVGATVSLGGIDAVAFGERERGGDGDADRELVPDVDHDEELVDDCEKDADRVTNETVRRGDRVGVAVPVDVLETVDEFVRAKD
jgi:hypothetical protein